jgi:hypothetical protein
VVSFEVAWIAECGGKDFVFLSIVFETYGFCLEGTVEARADVVGFVVVVQGGWVRFCVWGVSGLNFF